MCAFIDLYEDHEGMKWKIWIWWMDVCKGLKWMEGMKVQVVECKDLEWMEYKVLEWTWMEEFWIWKEQKAYQHLETLLVHWDTYYFQHKM